MRTFPARVIGISVWRNRRMKLKPRTSPSQDCNGSREQNRRLILFVENLNLVFERGLTDATQATLRTVC